MVRLGLDVNSWIDADREVRALCAMLNDVKDNLVVLVRPDALMSVMLFSETSSVSGTAGRDGNDTDGRRDNEKVLNWFCFKLRWLREVRSVK